jgi:D-arabinose 1-dehydrogenase-like Zn-dependent alcohol dehydrogenase
MNQRVLFLLFNHTITNAQMNDAKNSMEIDKVIEMPHDIKAIWSNIPPDLECLCGYLEPVKTWLAMTAKPGDYVLIQGDFGATYLAVRFAFKQGLIPVYSTTHRHAEEQLQQDGSIRVLHRFEHCMFRKYGG